MSHSNHYRHQGEKVDPDKADSGKKEEETIYL